MDHHGKPTSIGRSLTLGFGGSESTEGWIVEVVVYDTTRLWINLYYFTPMRSTAQVDPEPSAVAEGIYSRITFYMSVNVAYWVCYCRRWCGYHMPKDNGEWSESEHQAGLRVKQNSA